MCFDSNDIFDICMTLLDNFVHKIMQIDHLDLLITAWLPCGDHQKVVT